MDAKEAIKILLSGKQLTAEERVHAVKEIIDKAWELGEAYGDKDATRDAKESYQWLTSELAN